MSNKLNNKKLLLILAALALIFFATDYFREHKKQQGALPEQLLTFDTTAVQSIGIAQHGPKKETIQLVKQNNQWQVNDAKRNLTAPVAPGVINELFTTLKNLTPQRMVAKKRTQWSQYDLTDSLATQVTIQLNPGNAVTLYVGKFKYQQSPQQQYGYGGINGTTYVRTNNEAVYAVKGFLAMSINKGFNGWRNNLFLKTDKEAISNITLTGNQQFVLSQNENQWLIDGQPTDSTTVAKYLALFTNRKEHQFADQFKPKRAADYRLSISGNNSTLCTVQCWKEEENYYLQSSLNPDTYFTSTADGLVHELFVKPQHFIKQ